MAAAKPTTKDGENLVAYRLTQVEIAVKDMQMLISKQDNIKKADLVDFRDAILQRFNEKNQDFEEALSGKASKQELTDFKKMVWAVFTLGGSILAAVIIYYLTSGAHR